MFDADLGTVTVVALAFTAGGLVKGVLGIGLPLVAMPLATLVLPPPTAIALTLVPIFISNVWQAWDSSYLRIALHRFGPLLVAMLAGTAIGGRWLAGLDAATASAVIGFLLLFFCALQMIPGGLNLPAERELWANPVAGLAGGLIGGVSGIFSLIASYLLMLDLNKEQFVGSIALIYLVAGAALYVVLATYASHSVNAATLAASALATVPLLAGMLLGRWLRRRIPPEQFRRLLIALLTAIGIVLIRRGFQAQ